MEPQHGHVWVERQQGTKDSGVGHSGGSFWMSDTVRRWFGSRFGYLARENYRVLFRTFWYPPSPHDGLFYATVACGWTRKRCLSFRQGRHSCLIRSSALLISCAVRWCLRPVAY